MTMRFQLIRDSVIDLLGTAGAGKFRVVGFQEAQMSGEENLDANQSVQVFYQKGEIPSFGKGSSDGFQHNITYHIELVTSKASEGDLAVLKNTSDPAAIVVALGNLQDAGFNADRAWDQLFDDVVQALMSPLNLDLKVEKTIANPNGFFIGSRMCKNVEKDQPVPFGDLVTLTGGFDLTCSVKEIVVGEIPTDSVASGANDVDIEIQDDDTGKAAVSE